MDRRYSEELSGDQPLVAAPRQEAARVHHVDSQILKRLRGIVGREHVTAARTDLICYSYDATQLKFIPELVVYPGSAQEIAQILRLANEERIPVTPRGAGSGFSGGSVPVNGGIVVVTTRLNQILRIDRHNLVAEVECGVVTEDLQKAVEEVGLFYPPDPASSAFSTMGGNVAECAGGPRCVKYGVTKHYVLGLEVVTPMGDVIRTGGETMKGVVGYDLTMLLCGSEGTLGIITKIIVRLLPLPKARRTMLVAFDSIDRAAQAVADITSAKIVPTTLEFMDATSIESVRRYGKLDVPSEARAILIVEVDGDAESVERQICEIEELLGEKGVVGVRVAKTKAESDEIWRVRRLLSPSLRRVNPDKFNEDICVPRCNVPNMIRAIEEISSHYGIPIVSFGHAGDGNIHVNIMIDKRIDTHAEKAERAIEEIFKKAIGLQGTMSGEHGVGITKAPYLYLELQDEVIAIMKAVKAAFDPKNVLNPGKMFLSAGPSKWDKR